MSFRGKSILLDQLAACQDDESWFVPLSVALHGVDAERAAWKESESTNSICQIVNHLTFWNRRWLGRFHGTLIATEPVDNDTTFDLSDITEMSWYNAVAELNSVLTEWRTTISESGESKLETSIPNYEVDAPWWAAISNLVTHNVYHIGQIVYIRKLQGTWESRS